MVKSKKIKRDLLILFNVFCNKTKRLLNIIKIGAKIFWINSKIKINKLLIFPAKM